MTVNSQHSNTYAFTCADLMPCHAIEIRQIVTKGDNQQNKLSISRKATKLKMRFSVLLSLVKCMQPEEAKKIKKFETSFIHGCIFESRKRQCCFHLFANR